MLLEEFFRYKNQFAKDLIGNPRIVQLLTNDKELIAHPEGLIYRQIMPFEFIPDVIENNYTFICFDVDVQSVSGKSYLSPLLYVWVLAHKSELQLPEGGVRTDALCAEIDKTINGSRYYGLGELNLYAVKRFATATYYQGKVMTFRAIDVNRVAPTGKPVPVNRRRGE